MARVEQKILPGILNSRFYLIVRIVWKNPSSRRKMPGFGRLFKMFSIQKFPLWLETTAQVNKHGKRHAQTYVFNTNKRTAPPILLALVAALINTIFLYCYYKGKGKGSLLLKKLYLIIYTIVVHLLVYFRILLHIL